MKTFDIVVCAGIVPDPLQTLEPVQTDEKPGLKNEMMLPHVLDPWAEHALYEAANLVKQNNGKVYVVSIGPKAKLQQVMMTIAQKVPFQLVAADAAAGGFSDSKQIATRLAELIRSIDSLDLDNMLVFGGWESASRGAGTTMQMVGELLDIPDQFQGVDNITFNDDDSFDVLERIEGGKHLRSTCKGLPAMLAWATGYLPEPPNNPQIGMTNMRTVMPALQQAKPADIKSTDLTFVQVELPGQKRETKIVKDVSEEQIAQELIDWMKSK